MMKPLITSFVLLIAAFAFAGEAVPGQSAPDFTLLDSNGQKHSLSDYKGKIVVLEWVNFGCPFVKKHYNSTNMQTLQAKYTGQKVVWLSICSSAPGKQGYLSQSDINKELSNKGFKATAYLVDSEGDVGRLYGAQTTPHMFVIDKKGVLIYMGAIDDIRSTDVDDIAKAKNYVSSTLDALLAGESVEPFKTAPYGCSVKY